MDNQLLKYTELTITSILNVISVYVTANWIAYRAND
nr:MAG TPA: hypothetical protein [Caudoviricetes sp.]DAW17526.1 MAG TPA: hypothetical protein [Caudoviricetes sp.]